jgi:putative transposase
MDWRLRTRRRPAFNEPGHAHELTFTCQRRFKFLAAERTCCWLAEAIDAARKALDFALWAYVFKPEHVHLIVHPRRVNYDVSALLAAIKEPVGRTALKYLRAHAPDWLPRLAVRRGTRTEHRFWRAGGGYDRNVLAPGTLRSMIEYLHQNPLRRGLPERACDWKWSSAGWYEGAEPNTLPPDPLPPGALEP